MTGEDDDGGTGLPILTTWRATYVVVVMVLAAYVAGLAALSGLSP